MRTFQAIPEKTGDIHEFKAKDYTDARRIVINHFDLSLNYTVVEVKKSI
ncbi:MAG: hypothetical protein P9M03_06860 [Candidatus Theseobacter exili]|nr:hypothetical protein [Candidatus Theseobacter exili]